MSKTKNLNFESTKFGIEIEFVVPKPYGDVSFVGLLHYFLNNSGIKSHDDCDMNKDPMKNYWVIKPDHSIYATKPHKTISDIDEYDGLEIASPILKGKKGLEQIKKVVNVLNYLGCKVNSTCGLHVHVDRTEITVAECIAILASYYHNQHLVDNFVSSERRNGKSEFCKKINLSDIVNNVLTIDLKENSDIMVNPKYSSIFVHDILKTLEYRQHHGTLDFNEISNWVQFCVNNRNEAIKHFRNHIKINRFRSETHFRNFYLNEMKKFDILKGLSPKTKLFFNKKLKNKPNKSKINRNYRIAA